MSNPPNSLRPNSIPTVVPKQKWHYPFWFGGSAASMAAVVTHPLDLGMLLLTHFSLSQTQSVPYNTLYISLPTSNL
jgi:hypothetical protein